MMLAIAKQVGYYWIFIALILPRAVSFTRSLREVHLHQGQYWDPLLETVDDVQRRLCPGTMACAETIHFLFDQHLSHRLQLFYKDYEERLTDGFLAQYAWLDSSDGGTQLRLSETLLEIQALMHGQILPRGSCNRKVIPYADKTHCRYFELTQTLGIAGRQLTAQNLALNVTLNLQAFTTVVEDLCNEMYYEHAEALGVFVLYRFIHPLLETDTYHRHAAQFERAIFAISVVLSEIEKLRGNLQHSMSFVLSFIRSARVFESFSPDGFPSNVMYLYYLRTLLSTPSIPPLNHTAVLFRQEMITDLTKLYNNIQERAVRVSLSMLLSTVSATSFYLAHQGLDDRAVQTLLHDIYSAICPELNYFAPHLSSSPLPQVNAARTTVKIGFVSSHFVDHSIGRILVEAMAIMQTINTTFDQREYSIEVFVYGIMKPIVDPVDVDNAVPSFPESDFITNVLRERFGERYVLLPMNIPFIRHRIGQDELDFLIFGDIGMELVSYLLAYSRLATFQVAFWGHPITTALPSIDYYLGLDDEVLHADSFYSEQLVRIEHINTVPVPMDKYNVSKNTSVLPSIGIPATAKVAIVFGRLFKFHPDFTETLANLAYHLHEENSYIVVFAENVLEFNNIVMERIKEGMQILAGSDVDRYYRMVERVKIVSFKLYFKVAEAAHIALDTFPYGGCITAHDSFYHGLPMVTLPAEHTRGRYTLSLYRQMQYTELLCADRGCYISKALRLLRDDDYYDEQRTRVRYGFATEMKKNGEVAKAWVRFLLPVLLGQ